MITNYDERVKVLDDRISRAFSEGSSEGFIAGLMNLRNYEILLRKKQVEMLEGAK